MHRPAFLASSLVLSMSLGAHALSGKVQDLSGAPLPDIRVVLATSGASTWTDSLGRWSLGATSSAHPQTSLTLPGQGSLLVRDGHLALSFEGRLADGRRLAGVPTTVASQAVKSHLGSPAARLADGADSLLVVHEGVILDRRAVDPSSAADLSIQIDTAGVEGALWRRDRTFGLLRDARDGRTYRTLAVGNRTWMAENLDHQAPGLVTPWVAGSIDSGMKYGRLYTWTQALALADSCVNRACSTLVRVAPRGICPMGWHVPSEDDWDSLASAVGGNLVAGLHLRSMGGWKKGAKGTDSLGIRLLGAGRRDTDGAHRYQSTDGYFWTRTENSRFDAVQKNLTDDADYLFQGTGKTDAFAVRCIAD